MCTADESERLPESEFVMDLSLQQELGAEGEVRVAETKAAAKRAWVEPEVGWGGGQEKGMY
jgi:hypothetical protein